MYNIFDHTIKLHNQLWSVLGTFFVAPKEEAVKGGSCDALSLGNIILDAPVYEYQKPFANLNLKMQILREHFPMIEGWTAFCGHYPTLCTMSGKR